MGIGPNPQSPIPNKIYLDIENNLNELKLKKINKN